MFFCNKKNETGKIADGLNIIASVSSNFISVTPDNLDEKIEQTLKSLGEHFELDKISCYEYSKDLDQVCLNNKWIHEPMLKVEVSNDNIKASSFTWLVNEFVKNGKSIITDLNTLSREALVELEELGMKNSRTLLSIPIRHDDRVLGFIILQSMKKSLNVQKMKKTCLCLLRMP